MIKRIFIASLALTVYLTVVMTPSYSQILDDSTQLVYGAYTTYYTTFERIKNNDFRLTKIDTLVENLHNFEFVSRDYRYQDLGVIGTSMKPVFYEPPKQIGAYAGFTSYEPYYITKDDIKFYDTKSPYTLIDARFGGNRRSITNVMHTRNINPYWNAGIGYRRLTIEKQLNSSGRNDNQVVSTGYYFHTHYQSADEKYTGMGAFSRLYHRVQENGGVDSAGFFTRGQYFDPDANVNLRNAESADLRMDFFTYHQYRWKRQLQLYYQWDQIGTKYYYTNKPLGNPNTAGSDAAFYDQILINPDSTVNRARFRESIHEPGLKGSAGNLHYIANAKFRKVTYLHQYLPDDFSEFETYVGLTARYDFDSLKNHSLNARAEYKLGRGYYLRGNYTNKYFSVFYQKSRYEPAVIHQDYFGNHNEWHNSFEPVNSDYVKGRIDVDLKFFRFSPTLSLMNINNNIYFDEEGNPAQASGNAQVMSPGVEFDFHFFNNAMHWENEVIYTLVSGEGEAADAFRIPELFANSKLYFGKPVFSGKINVAIGLQAHYKSDYYAHNYDPATRQFYLQNDFVIPSYLLVDAFANFRIDHVAVFLRYENVTQPNNDGYFTFPNYVGQSRVFDLGVSWMFFD